MFRSTQYKSFDPSLIERNCTNSVLDSQRTNDIISMRFNTTAFNQCIEKGGEEMHSKMYAFFKQVNSNDMWIQNSLEQTTDLHFSYSVKRRTNNNKLDIYNDTGSPKY